MSIEIVSRVFKESRSKGNARLVLLCLADEANAVGEVRDYTLSHAALAAKANCSESAVRRSVKELVELGELEVLDQGTGRAKSTYRVEPRGFKVNTLDEHPECSTLTTLGGQPGTPRVVKMTTPYKEPVIPIVPVIPVAPPSGDAAARAVWESKSPRPAIPFVAVRTVASKLLEAGWGEDAVVKAMIAAPTISIRSVEIVLNRGRGARSPKLVDRDGPVGQVSEW